MFKKNVESEAGYILISPMQTKTGTEKCQKCVRVRVSVPGEEGEGETG